MQRNSYFSSFSFSVVSLAALVTLPLACVNPTNPYDVDAPDELQARASYRGELRANVPGQEPPAIEGAEITLTLSDGSDASDTTDEDGVFVLTDLPAGNARIVVTHPDFQAYSADLSAFGPGEERAGIVLFLSPFSADGQDLATVTGVVLKEGEDIDHSGIVVRDANDDTFFGVTQRDGSVTLRVAPGLRELVVDEFGFEAATIEVDAAADAQTDFGQVTLPFIPGEVFGQVGVENPAVAQSISISLDRGGVDQVVADGDGNYRLPVVPAGTYRLTAFADGHDAVEFGGVTVVPDEETEVPPLFLSRSRGAIVGVARYAPGFDADNSGIVVSVAGSSSIGTTDSDGNFLIENVPTNVDGGYTLAFRADDFLTQTVAGVLVNKNATTTLDQTVVLAKQIGDFEIVPAPFTNTADVTLRLAPIPQGATQLRIAEDSAFTGVDFAPFPTDIDGNIVTDVPYTIASDDGQATLYVQYLLDDGAEAGPFSSSVVLDRVAPVIDSITLDDGRGVTNADNVLVHVEATDANVPTRYEVSEIEAFDNPAAIVSNAYGVPTRVTFADTTTDGPRTVFVRVFDAAGNISATSSATITRDTTPPGVVSFSLDCQGVVDAAVCSDTSVDLTIDAPEAAEWFVSLSPGPQPEENDWNSFQDALVFSGLGLAQGERTLYLVLRDAAGNVSDVFSDAIIVDTAPPSAASVLVDSGAAFIAGGRTTVQLSLFALGASQMRISADPDTTDDPAVAYAPTAEVTLPAPLVDGPLTYYVTFVDAAGNEVTVSDSITVDTVAPSPGPLPITIDGQAAFTASLSVTLSLDAIDADEMRLSVDDTSTPAPPTVSDWIPFAATSLALLPAGDCGVAAGACKQVCARFRDEAGNETPANVCATISLDATAPTPVIIAAAPIITNSRNATVTLAGPSTDTNFSAYEVLVTPGGAGFETIVPATAVPSFDLNLPFATLPVGPEHLNKTTYIIRLRGVDAAGNIGPEATHQVIYDEWDPPAPVLASAPTTVNADTYSLLFDNTQNQAPSDATFAYYETAQIFCNGFQRATCEAAGTPALFTPSAQRDGLLFTLEQGGDTCSAPCVNRLFVRAVDGAGNAGPATSVIIDEDSVAPSKPKMLPKSASTYGERAVMRLDGLSNDDTDVIYEIRGGQVANYTPYDVGLDGIFAIPLLRNETNEICLRARDEAGNFSVEECSVIHQEEQLVVAQEDEIDFLHLEDNYLSYMVNRRVMKIQDIRTDTRIEIGGPLFHDTSAYAGSFEPFEIPHGSVAVHDGKLQIGFAATGRGDDDEFYSWFGYKEIPLSDASLVPQPADACGSPPYNTNNNCDLGIYVDLNTPDPVFQIDEDARIFVGAGFIVTRRFQFEAGVGQAEGSALHVLFGADPSSPSLSRVVNVMSQGRDLCTATEVEIVKAGDRSAYLIWCESDDGERGEVFRSRVTVTGTDTLSMTVTRPVKLGDTNIELADLFDGANRFNQPVATATAAYWVDDGEVRTLPHTSGPGIDTNLDVELNGTIKRLAKTVEGDRLVMIRFIGAAGQSPAFVYTYDLNETGERALRQITNGVVTPYDAVVDNARVMWTDRATLRSAAYFQALGDLEWQAHGEQITAFPTTDGTHTTFIDARDGSVGFYAYHDVEGLEYELTDELALEGFNDGGRQTAAGQTLWVRRGPQVPVRYQIMVSDVTDIQSDGSFPISCPVPFVAGANATDPVGLLAIEDEGQWIAFSQGTSIYRSRRAGACEWENPVVIADILPDERVRDIDILDFDGTPMIAWVRSSEVQRDQLRWVHGGRGGEIADNDEQGFQGYYPESVELGMDGNTPVFAATFFADDTQVPSEEPFPPAGRGVLYCPLAQSGTGFCTQPKTVISSPVIGSGFDRPSLGENGLLVMTNSAPTFETTSHITVVDTRTGRYRALTPAFYGDFAARDPSTGFNPNQVDGTPKVVFSSTRLGAVDVWAADLIR